MSCARSVSVWLMFKQGLSTGFLLSDPSRLVAERLGLVGAVDVYEPSIYSTADRPRTLLFLSTATA
jgi:hypothetical protein